VDRHGNAAAVTTSLGAQFLVIGDTGIHINERMKFFSLEEDNPNLLEPRKKVRHTSNPYMALRQGQPYILGGNTGVDTQPQAQVQQFLNIVEFGLDAQEAVAQPRFVSTAFPGTRPPSPVGNTLQVETAFPAETVAELRARGHDVEVGEGIFGSANVIIVQEDGLDAQVGAEPRDSMSSGMVTPVEVEE
jgi:gamma-glutamyltranspeptidase